MSEVAQCWCGEIYDTSEELTEHWAEVVKSGGSVLGHERPPRGNAR